MPRIRSLKPEFCSSPDIAVLTIPCRLHFAMLWTYADDEGRGLDDPRLIKAALWPLDDDVDVDQVEAWQAELAAAGRLHRYQDGSRRYFAVDNFKSHQHPNRPQRSKLPAPPLTRGNDTSRPEHEPFTADAVHDPEQLTPVVVEERRGEGEGEESSSPSTTPPPTEPPVDDDQLEQQLAELAEADLARRQAEKGPVGDTSAWLRASIAGHRKRLEADPDYLDSCITSSPAPAPSPVDGTIAAQAQRMADNATRALEAPPRDPELATQGLAAARATLDPGEVF